MGNRHDPGLDTNGLMEAARLVRSRLTSLVGPAADDLDGRIASLLAQSQEAPEGTAAARLGALMRERAATAGFLDRVLADAPHYRPPELQESGFRGEGWVSGLGGPVGPVGAAGRFRCLHGDFVWYRPAVGTPVPDCPTHGATLGPA